MEKKELIEKLFSWTQELEIVGKDDQIIKVYQRLVGDADLNKARMLSLRYSKTLRDTLSDENSDEYKLYLEDIHTLNRDDLLSMTLFGKLIDIRREIDSKFYFPEPEEPLPDATNEQLEKYQADYDSWEERRKTALTDIIKSKIDEATKELELKSDAELATLAKRSKINMLCEEEIQTKFAEACAFLGTYEDKDFKKRVYTVFEEYLNSPEQYKKQISDGYEKLEMSSVSLKESRRVVSSDQSSA